MTPYVITLVAIVTVAGVVLVAQWWRGDLDFSLIAISESEREYRKATRRFTWMR